MTSELEKARIRNGNEDGTTMTPVAMSTPDMTPVKTRAGDFLAQAKALVITDNATYQQAAELAKAGNALKAEITDLLKDLKGHQHKAWQATCELERKLSGAPDEGVRILKAKIVEHVEREDKKRRAEEAELAKLAKQRAEDRQLEEAAEQEAAGNKEAAEAIVSRPVEAPVVALPRPKAEGVSTALVWAFEVLDVTKLKPEFLLPNEAAIRAIVNALKDNAGKTLGEGAVRIFQKTQPRIGR